MNKLDADTVVKLVARYYNGTDLTYLGSGIDLLHGYSYGFTAPKILKTRDGLQPLKIRVTLDMSGTLIFKFFIYYFEANSYRLPSVSASYDDYLSGLLDYFLNKSDEYLSRFIPRYLVKSPPSGKTRLKRDPYKSKLSISRFLPGFTTGKKTWVEVQGWLKSDQSFQFEGDVAFSVFPDGRIGRVLDTKYLDYTREGYEDLIIKELGLYARNHFITVKEGDPHHKASRHSRLASHLLREMDS